MTDPLFPAAATLPAALAVEPEPPSEPGAPAASAEEEALAAARRAAHAAADAAARAWYAYAGLAPVGPERVRAFEVYARLHRARFVG